MNHEIKGEPFPVVICNLASGESVKCQAGAMAWMTENMEMKTQSGGLGKMFGKALTGEALFENIYTANNGDGMIAFTTGVPGKILDVQLSGGKTMVAQKKSFLASSTTIEMETTFQKKFGAGLLGGEGFVMQKFSGEGDLFLEIDGAIVEYDLQPGQVMIVDTGSLACMEGTVQMDVVSVKGGLGNKLVGGEGFFNTKLTGPGKIWLQTMPVSQLAEAIKPFIPTGR
ncbi:MAG: TIGR00266 family protein [Lachnospiraceae bacterium]|nr:TIGR00266 family protein [Lachnospiraceae bacterium]MBQ4276332.1 TIGR00266 family protein [Lachnospiraceae bacterium]